MSEPLYAFIALAGSALLGFLFSTSIARLRNGKLLSENANLEAIIKEKEATVSELQLECETKVVALREIENISQEIENQVIEKDRELKQLQKACAKIQEELQYLIDNPIEKIKEIDVIREVPVLIFKEIGLQETRVEKAKKLMKAFTKGYLDENGLLQVMAKEEIIDEE